MPFQPPPRLTSVLASVLAAGLMLTVASCSRLTPLGPDPAATMPQPRHLRSPLVLQAMRVRQPTPAGGCPAGYVTLPGGAGPRMCYGTARTRVTITSAGVSPVSRFQPPGQQAGPVLYGFWISLPAADVPALTAVTRTVSGPPGTSKAATSALTVSFAGRTRVVPLFATRFAGRELEVLLSSRNQAVQLQHTLASPG